MKQAELFAEVLRDYVRRSAYRPSQLARLSGIPPRTIAHWLEGLVRRPRTWQDVARLAQALRLNRLETDTLLTAAGYPLLEQLRGYAGDETEQALLAFWTEVSPLPAKAVPFQIIPDLPTFVGREALLARLRGLLLADYHEGAYLLAGTVGVGKTVLVVRLAYQMRSHFRDGVLWARLDTMPIMSILQLWGQAYGRDVSAYQDLDSRSVAIRELLATRQTLIVLDNVPNEAQVAPLLPANGPCAVLITSRRRQLTTLPEHHRFHIGSFTEAETLALWTRVLGEERVNKEQALLQEIASVVGHHPLALDLLACRLAYEAGWQTAVLLQQLKNEPQRLNLVSYGERGLSAALETSYSLLPSTLQRFFAALGTVNKVDFTVDEAADRAGVSSSQAENYLRELFALCLVRRGRELNDYRLIPVLRDFAQSRNN